MLRSEHERRGQAILRRRERVEWNGIYQKNLKVKRAQVRPISDWSLPTVTWIGFIAPNGKTTRNMERNEQKIAAPLAGNVALCTCIPMSLITPPGVTPLRPIELRTKLNRPVDNDQPLELSSFVKKQAKDFDLKYGHLRRRNVSDPSYNCHGLVFASRRTWVLHPSAVEQILREDGYIEVREIEKILPGDVIVYYLEGEATHSGIVLVAPTKEAPALIFGKWAAWDEVIHEATTGPYAMLQMKYYRMP